MYSEKAKTLFFVAWAVAVCLAATAMGMTSIASGIVVACVAIVPIVVAATSGGLRSRPPPNASRPPDTRQDVQHLRHPPARIAVFERLL